ncbi:LemA family protein [Rhodococcus sp. ABRD24]|uniref:LemA family protein n=1 Tax=Rhodococcus sp. ABRD24 TaxID=2507582 RepID=UPI00103BCF3C|nr:LemA family protein [Rhodococcus sp. ABRD24]QBJ95937.1 LemA family protein [Rhodococcus sp. ABRD24]
MTAVVWVVSMVRRLRRTESTARAALALVHVELDRRYEYIPGLVLASAETVGRDLVSTVSGARALAMRVREENLDLCQQAGAESALSAALQSLLGTARCYPALRHDWAFVRPAGELELTEERLAGAVRVYNDLARRLNHAVCTPPTSVVARFVGVKPAQLFEATILTVSGAPEDDVADAAA